MQDKSKWSFDTKLIHGGYEGDPQTGATVVPIYQSTAFAHDTAQELSDIFNNRKFGYTYSRIANPTVTAFESLVNTLENGRGAAAVASGMAATSVALQCLVKHGDEILAGNSLFGGTYYMLQEFAAVFGVKVVLVEATDINAYKNAISDKTKVIFCETIGNPKLDVPDIQAISDLAKLYNIPVVVDSTTASPYLIDLKTLGVSISVQSATKWLGGQGTTLGGVIIDLGNFDWKKTQSLLVAENAKKMGDLAFLARCKKLRSNMGATLSPINAFMLSSGVQTLALRFQRQCENALKVAHFLAAHPKVKEVRYPGLSTDPFYSVASKQFKNGFGGLLTFKLANKEACFNCVDQLKMIKNLANLGDNKTLIVHPDTTIYRDLTREEKDAAGAYENLLRISVGIESVEDIISDLQQALEG